MEEWRPVPGYDGRYEVSNLGNVRSYQNGKIRNFLLKARTRGYVRVGLMKDQIPRSYGVHRLVAMAFLNGTGFDVNHKNGIRDDNRLENLEYASRRENTNHSPKRSGKMLKGAYKSKHGRFYSLFSYKGKTIYLGRHDTELQAHNAYMERIKQIGEQKYASTLSKLEKHLGE